MTDIAKINFLSNFQARRTMRTLVLFIYFCIFQSLILIQKPFLQFDFIVIFYLTFGTVFGHHLFYYFSDSDQQMNKPGFFSYALDFIALIVFMKYFPYLSSFILVLQLFLLFVASLDMDFFGLCLLGFISSLGASLVNLSTYQSGSTQSILSLTLFNLSYFAVIIVSQQLKSEFFVLQTDLSQTRKRWRSQERFLKSLVEKIPMGLAVLDQKQEFVLQNSYLLENLQLSNEKFKNLMSLYNRRSSQHNPDVAYKLDDNSEKKIFNFSKTNYFDEEVNDSLELYLIKDVTEVRLLEDQLKETEKLAAVGQLAAGIAHEIRNPLAGISGSIQMLSQEVYDPSQKKLMNIVLREIDRLNLLITEFLNYAKPEKAPDAIIDLKQVVEEVILSTKSRPELKSDFEWKIQLQSAGILGFAEKIKQAALNIIINSIQAMNQQDKASLEINLKKTERHAILSIKDNGSGMTEENRKKMFEPFHTTKPKGTGLGLAITHKILETHKAQIEVRSEVNLGTEFIIKFPLVGNSEEII